MFKSSKSLFITGYNLFVSEGKFAFGAGKSAAAKWRGLAPSVQSVYIRKAVEQTPRFTNGAALYKRATGGRFAELSEKAKAEWRAKALVLSQKATLKKSRICAESLFAAEKNCHTTEIYTIYYQSASHLTVLKRHNRFTTKHEQLKNKNGNLFFLKYMLILSRK